MRRSSMAILNSSVLVTSVRRVAPQKKKNTFKHNTTNRPLAPKRYL